MKRLLALLTLGLMVVTLAPRPAHAANLFEVIAESDATGEVRVGGSSLIDLAEKLIRNRNEFADFADERNFSASLTYGGVRDAFRLEFFDEDDDPARPRLRLQLITGFERVFEGDNRDELEDQIVDFLESDGAREYAKFQREMERRSLVALLDGNPGSTTALLSRQSFRRYGSGQIGPMWFDHAGVRWPAGQGRRGWFAVNPIGDIIDAHRFSGEQYGLDMNSGFWFTDHVGFTVSSVFAYRDIEGAEALHGGVELGLPIQLVPPQRGGRMNVGWQVTPFGTLGGAGSVDMVAGGLIWGAGVTSHIHTSFRQFDLVAANQIAFYEGLRLKVGDYEFRPELSQRVLTNGVFAHYPIGQRNTFVLEVGLSHTRYLSDAAVRQWYSPSVGLNFRTSSNNTVKINYAANIGKNRYRSHTIQAGFNFQF